jgi:hypothetical protein
MYQGVLTTLITGTDTLFANTWYTLGVSYANAQMNFTINNEPFVYTFDARIPFGYPGAYATTDGFFDNMFYATPCSGCTGISNQGTCTFTVWNL